MIQNDSPYLLLLPKTKPMKKKLLPLLAFFMLLQTALSQQTNHFTQSIYFDTGEDVLSAESIISLDNLISALKATPDFDLQIEAFTDDVGTETYNESLARRRAGSTAEYLLSKDIQPRSSTIKNFGESRQLDADDLDEKRRINRRVDILITSYIFDDLKDLMTRLKDKTPEELFQFRQTSDEEMLTSENGTQVIIPSNCFVFEDGTVPKGKITFTMKEAYTQDQWILYNLTTETEDGQLLQTGGMVYTEASSEGKKLVLTKDKKITISVPVDESPDSDMQLFYGNRHVDNTDDAVKWRVVPAAQIRKTLRKKAKSISLSDEAIAFLKTQKFNVPTAISQPDFENWLLAPEEPNPVGKKPVFKKKKPKREKFVYRAYSFWDRLRSEKYKQAWEQKMYDIYLARYKKAEKKYKEKVLKYEANVLQHEIELKKYNVELNKFKADRSLRIKVWLDYIDNKWTILFSKEFNKIASNADKIKIPASTKGASLTTIVGRLIERKLNFNGDYITDENLMIEYNEKDYTALTSFLSLIFREEHNIRNFLKQNSDFNRFDEINQDAVIASLERTETRVLNAYVVDVAQLGWANIDKLLKYKKEEKFAISVVEPDEAMVMVILPEIKSSIGMKALTNGTYQSSIKIPTGVPATLVAMKVEDGKTKLAIQKFVVGDGEVPVLSYKSLSVQKIRRKLKEING